MKDEAQTAIEALLASKLRGTPNPKSKEKLIAMQEVIEEVSNAFNYAIDELEKLEENEKEENEKEENEKEENEKE